jgi:hypothetical protein
MGQLQVALDALNGSCHVYDNGNLFTYGMETRKRVRDELSELLGNIILETEITEKSNDINEGS